MGRRNKKAQEEIVGFALIIIIVSIVLLFLLFFALKNGKGKENVESFEVSSFLQSTLQYTSSCQLSQGSKEISMQNLIFECVSASNGKCADNREFCEVMESDLEAIIDKAWPVGSQRPLKGTESIIMGNGQEVLKIENGNKTANFKGGLEHIAKGSDSVDFSMKAYF